MAPQVSPALLNRIQAAIGSLRGNRPALALGAGVPALMASQACACKSQGQGFAGYSGAGTMLFTSTGAGSQITQTLNIQGAYLPADSVLMFVASVTAAGGSVALSRITQITVDEQPMYIGTSGIWVASLDARNQTGLSQRIGATATRLLSVTVTFGAGSLAGDAVALQVARFGELSQQTLACAA